MASVECSVPEHLLLKRTGVIDDATRFGEWTEYFLPDVTMSAAKPVLVRVAHYERTIFEKKNPFAAADACGLVSEGQIVVELEPGKRSAVSVDSLQKKLVEDDNDDEWVAIVEFRVPGGDRPVSRSAHVFKKRGLTAQAQQGGLS